jgi:hypothetical protein
VWLLVTKPHLLFKATTLPEKQVGVGVSPSRDEIFYNNTKSVFAD